jgi:glucose/arabinose dehydrogenase
VPAPHYASGALATPLKLTSPHNMLAAGAKAKTFAQELKRQPMFFEQNLGQSDPDVLFIARGRDYQLFLTEAEAVLSLQAKNTPESASRGSGLRKLDRVAEPRPPAVLRVAMVGAQKPKSVVGADAVAGQVNYLHGSDKSGWRTGVPSFARVEYRGVYPGIDLIYHSAQQQLEFDFVVAAGADPSRVLLTFNGADAVSLGDAGQLILASGRNEVVLPPPVVFQDVEGERRKVTGSWLLDDAGRAGFSLGQYDPTLPLVIDPIVQFATYFGGGGSEDALDNMGVALDASGNIYIAGTTDSADFPLTKGRQKQFSGITDVFVMKMDPTGSKIIYTSYLGGSGHDSGQAIEVDSAGNVYVGGFTDSVDFPTMLPLQAANAGSFDGFITKIDATGATLVYSTYIGGIDRDFVLGLDVDLNGAVYVTGDVESPNFPTVNALQPTWGGVWDAWLAKLNPAGSALVFSTYLGGTQLDSGFDVKVDLEGKVYVSGFTNSANFPTSHAYQATLGGDVDAFVTKLTPSGTAFVYSTYLGGTNTDRSLGLDVDNFGNAYLVGDTLSTDFPNVGSIVSFGGFFDAFVAKLDGNGVVKYTNFVGGGVSDNGMAIAVDGSGNAHITGMTFSHNFLLVQPLQDHIAGNFDAFVSTIDASGTRIMLSTFLGGSGGERALGIAVDRSGNLVVVGDTYSSDFPTVKPVQSALRGERDIFVARITDSSDIVQDPAVQIEQTVAGLVGPRAMAFIGNGDLLVLENSGAVRRVRNRVLEPLPLLQLAVNPNMPGHPHSVAVHPGFPATPFVYFYFTEVDKANGSIPLGSRVYRYTWSANKLINPLMVLNIPVGNNAGSETGAIAFGPDGKLYVTSGDSGGNSETKNIVGGSPPDDTAVVFRLNPDGTTPSDNPFFASGGKLARYYAYGVRSSTGIAFDPVNGMPWVIDQGTSEYDEINIARPGFNSGSTKLRGPMSRQTGTPSLVIYPGSAYRDPVFSWRTPVVPGAMTFISSEALGDHYRNHLFVGGGDGNLYHFNPNPSRTGLLFVGAGMKDLVADNDIESSESLFGVGFGAITDLEVGPDQDLYVLSAARGALYRVYWQSDVEIKLSATKSSLVEGGQLPITLDLRNKTDKRQDFAMVLSMMLPDTSEFQLVGPVALALPPNGNASGVLPLTLPSGMPLGTWTFKGQIVRTGAGDPEMLDISAFDFDLTK